MSWLVDIHVGFWKEIPFVLEHIFGVQGDARDVVETFSKRFGIISEAFWEHAWTLAITD